ncbi:uncharacterized protein LOC116294854 [Actinia tenebrosa]|uniref:Uncharacterized protein LOC116294854 n=1 Tax=Actinia tenebrosa TaxID=6105 RepID=A0A6P8I0I2_ACTTE|nr:uncharacterized protein LOC116294854 [Actinia tenebrosa]
MVFLSIMEVKVLHEGNLEKCSSADDHGKKDWKRRYFVFKYFPASSTRCLEYYKDKSWRKQDPKGVLTLHPGYEVVKVHDSKRKYVFDVKTVEHVFRLSANNEDELNKWILTLERENIVKSFIVEPVPSGVMNRTGATEKCHLHITDTEVRLISAQDGNQFVAWPFTCLRRYMSSRGKFSLEAGRRAPTGEGNFVFITPQHDEIYKLLDNVIKSRAGNNVPIPMPPNQPAKVQRSESMQSTLSIQSVASTAVPEEDGYDHLMCSPLAGFKPVHPVHPNYDQNIIHSPQKTENQKSNNYEAPYGHMKNRESLASMRGQMSFDAKASEYNTLDPEKMTSKIPSSTGKGNDILEPSRPQKPPPPLPANFDRNTMTEHQNDGVHSPSSQMYDNNQSPVSQDTNTYDSLDHGTSVPKQGIPACISLTNAFHNMRNSMETEDTYNVLSYPGSSVSSPEVKNQPVQGDGGQNADEHRSNISQHTSFRQSMLQPLVPPRKNEVSGQAIPVPPPRVPRNDRTSQGVDRSSVSSVSSMGSSFCPLDMSGSYRDSQLSMSADQDFYSSIGEKSSPPKSQPASAYRGSRMGPDSPTEPKQIAPKPRKTGTQANKTHENLVSNLKATLLADGLNLSKILPSKIAQRRSSADAIPENDTYAEVDDGDSKGSYKTRIARSPSAPMNPIEDIYEDPEKSSYR